MKTEQEVKELLKEFKQCVDNKPAGISATTMGKDFLMCMGAVIAVLEYILGEQIHEINK